MTKAKCLKEIYQALGGTEDLDGDITVCKVLDKIKEVLENLNPSSGSEAFKRVGGENQLVDIRTLDVGLYMILQGSKYQTKADGTTTPIQSDMFMFVTDYWGSKSALMVNTSAYALNFHYWGLDVRPYVMSNILLKDNKDSWVPTGDYNPATKKYVDDKIAALRAELGGVTNE